MFVSRWIKEESRGQGVLLHKCVTFAAASLVLLQLDKLESAERVKDILEVCFSDAEVNITHIKSVKRRGVLRARASFGVTSLAVFLRLGQLSDDGNA